MTIKLIFLCGQSCAGKSTLAHRLAEYYQNQYAVKIISIDDIPVVDNREQLFSQECNKVINSLQYSCVILDAAFDSKRWRREFLSALNIADDIAFDIVVVQLRPSFIKTIKRLEMRTGKILTQQEISNLALLYANYEYIVANEFSTLSYKSLYIYLIDPVRKICFNNNDASGSEIFLM